MTSPLISATLIYDGQGDPQIPAQLLPQPRDGKDAAQLIADAKQLQGTPLERLCELAGRACYDSLGRGRDSVGYHQHILDVKHLSTVEHATVTIEWPCGQARTDLAQALGCAFLNRPSLFVRMFDRPDTGTSLYRWYVRVTVNLRHILEWNNIQGWSYLGAEMAKLVHPYAPHIIPAPSLDSLAHEQTAYIVPPETDDEKWVTMLLTHSRGCSHELVRHGDWTAISQRSTRYVDESESRWVMHPLEDAYLTEHADDMHPSRGRVIGTAQDRYQQVVAILEPWLVARGVDKVSARKQARGAARGYLGNALYTEVVFSANLTQWRRMLRQRLNAAADAEIRQCFAGVLRELQRSRYADSFVGWTTAPSPDGIGEVLVEPS
jgi:thymidylate synthase ThyX